MSIFPYEKMFEKYDMLERLDITVQWGHYEINVLRFHLTSFQPGKVIDFHNHSEFEFHFIPRGRGEVILGDLKYPLSAGMLYLTGPGVMHRQEADSEVSMEELCLHVDIKERIREGVDPWEAAEAETCIQKLKQLPLVPTQDNQKAMLCFLEAYEALESKLTGYYTSIKHLVISILLKVVRAYDSGEIRNEAPVRDMLAYRYQFAIQYIEANYSGIVTLENVAEKLKISSRQLQRVFKQVDAERSFSKALEDIRLKNVCRMLKESNDPIEQVSKLGGFTNATYLHIVFRKRLGMTPATYRNRIHTN